VLGEVNLDCNDCQQRIEAKEIPRVAGDDVKIAFLSAHHNMSVDNIAESCFCQKQTNSLGVDSIKRNQFGPLTLKQTLNPRLSSRIANHLGEHGGGYEHSRATQLSSFEDQAYPPVATFQSNQAPCVYNDSR